MDKRDVFERLQADHAHVLAQLGALERAAGIADPPRRRPDPTRPHAGARPVTHVDERALRRLLRLLATQFDVHMAAEDEALLPALARALPESLGPLEPFRVEHRELRDMLAALESILERPPRPARDEQIAVQARDFVDLLRIHIRKEEVVVFRMAEQVLAPEQLTEVSERIRRGAARPSSKPAAPKKGKRP